MKTCVPLCALFFAFGSGLLSACGYYSGVGGHGGGGHNYVLAEKDVSPKRIAGHVITKYDAVSDTADFQVSFEIPENVPGTDQLVSIRLQTLQPVTVNDAPMIYAEQTQYILDNSKSDVVGGLYDLKVSHPDITKTFAIGWTTANGYHFVHLVNVPMNAEFSLE